MKKNLPSGIADASKARTTPKCKAIAGSIADANCKYYSAKGKGIYTDFSTFAQGKAIATSNAIEFCSEFSGRQGEITICEYGIGKGDFAKVFLSDVKARDEELYSRIRYCLFDLSEKMMNDARKNLASHSRLCEFFQFNAIDDAPSCPFDYCRINELLSDLPAEIYFRKGKDFFYSDGARAFLGQEKIAFLSRIDEGRNIPFSIAAERFLSALVSLGKKDFRIDLFDYGFYSADDIFSLPAEEWNRTIVREYGSQITVDLNFIELSASLASQGFSATVERQIGYCERVLGKPLEFSQTARGLDYIEKKKDDGISEDDGFYHLRVGV